MLHFKIIKYFPCQKNKLLVKELQLSGGAQVHEGDLVCVGYLHVVLFLPIVCWWHRSELGSSVAVVSSERSTLMATGMATFKLLSEVIVGGH